MPRYLTPKAVRAVQLTALANGGRLRTYADGTPSRTVEWDVSGKCLSPRRVELHGRAEAERGVKQVYVTPTCNRPTFVEMEVRCRKCANCLRQRSYEWQSRARAEFRDAPRTWLATLTLQPERYAHLLSIAHVRLSKQGLDLETFPEDEQWRFIEKPGFEWVQEWIRLLRKRTGIPIRYLCVTEAHKSGVPHWHLLLHEQDPVKPLRYSALKGSWPNGFASFNLVRDVKGAAYAAKYLSKEQRARVRASLRYGGGKAKAVAPTTPPVEEASDSEA